MSRVQSIRLHVATNLTLAEQWAVACGAHLTVLNGGYLNSIATGLPEESLREILTWWDFNDRESALGTIQWLFRSGHRLYFNHVLSVTAKYPQAEWNEQLVALAEAQHLDGDLIVYKDNIIAGYKRLLQLGFLDEGQFISTIGAWDFGRLINICRWSHDLGYLSEAEARQIIVQASQFLQPAYRSWEDLSLGYLMGRQMWGGSMDEVEDVHRLLLGDPTSPWRTIPYDLDLKAPSTVPPNHPAPHFAVNAGLPLLDPERTGSALPGSALPGSSRRPPLTGAQRFAIACGGHLTLVNDASFNALETGMSPEQHASLPDWWGITNRDTALGALKNLLDSGHREYYRLIVEVLDQYPPDEWDRQLRAVRRQRILHRDLVQYKNNLLVGFRELRSKGFLGQDERVVAVSAYDYSRAINVARWCHDLGYLSADEAGQLIRQSARALQAAYASWRDMGAAYLLGRYMWGANEYDMTDAEQAIQTLLTDPTSPWRQTDWNTPLE